MVELPLHEKLKKARLATGLTPEQAAPLAGLTFQTIYRAESGRFAITDKTLRALEPVYGLPTGYFSKGDADPYIPTEIVIQLNLPASVSDDVKVLFVKTVRTLAETLAEAVRNIHNDTPAE